MTAISLVLLLCGCSETTAPRGDAGNREAGATDAEALLEDRGPAQGDRGPGAGDALIAGDGPIIPLPSQRPPVVCSPPLSLVDTSSPAHTIGDGTPESCDEAALSQAVAAGGIITFNCGDSPAVVLVTATLQLRTDVGTVIDGGGKVTLSGGDSVRIFEFHSPDFRKTTTRVVLQRLTLRGGRAPAGDLHPKPASGDCAWGYKEGAGAGLRMRDGVLHVIDCDFIDNHAASPGPDVGGGAIYAVGALEVIVTGSRFISNDGSNGGAVGLLQSTGTFVNTLFEGNRATGEGQNFVSPGCPMFNHDEQGGAGGNGGALAVDGVEETELLFCGCTLKDNQAGELGGGMFRTPNGARRDTTFDRCTLDGNSAGKGGGGMYISNSLLTLRDSLIASNTVLNGTGGGVRTELNSEANFVNVTFFDNDSVSGLAGGLNHRGGGVIRNCTFALNKAEGGPGLFTAAYAGQDATITNTIFVNNTSADPYNPATCWFSPSPGARNFQWPRKRSDGSTDDTPCVEGITWADPQLGGLADNGGPTLTAMPAAGSVVIGAGEDCPDKDQRGEPRNPASCAAGAVEP